LINNKRGEEEGRGGGRMTKTNLGAGPLNFLNLTPQEMIGIVPTVLT